VSNARRTEPPGDLAGRREWLGLAVLALPTLLLAIDLGVLYLALPKLSADLEPSSTQVLWIMDIYAFMTAGFLITMGTIGDRIGRRRLLMFGAAAFGAASLLVAYSTSAEMLIASRALLGVAGAAVGPSTLALISTMFANERQRGMAIGVWMSCFMVGSVIGPIVGGLLLQWFWWGSVFLLGLPVMLLLLAAAPVLLPEHRDPDAGRPDLASVVLSMGALLPVTYGIKWIARDGLHAGPVAVAAAGVIVGAAFVRRQRRLTRPLIDVRLFRIPSFSGALGIMVLGPAVMGGVGLFAYQYLQLVVGLSPLAAGLWTVPPTLGTVAGSMMAPALVQRVPPNRLVCGGAVVLTVGALLFTQVDHGLPMALAGMTLVSFGFGPAAALGANLIMGSAPPEKAGVAASMSQTSSDLGVALGVGLLGVVGTAVYRSELGDTAPAGIPAQALDAARSSLAEAVAAAASLPGEHGPALLAAARDSFTSGFNAVGAACAVVGIAIALLAAFLIRTGPPPVPADEASAADGAKDQDVVSG
jgi:DHA2 family multidrug resistance protein-like MFS transporter